MYLLGVWFSLLPLRPSLFPVLNRRFPILTGGAGLGGGADLRKEFSDVHRILAVGAVHWLNDVEAFRPVFHL